MASKTDKEKQDATANAEDNGGDVGDGIVVNASGHKQELDRNFGLFSICAVGIVTGNAWAALGGSIVVALYNGGPPGVIYELIAVSAFYFLISACIAELASAIPSSAGVYHWASVTGGPRWGRACSWFAGWWNYFAWIFGAASTSAIAGNQVISMYILFHPELTPKSWQVFVVYIIVTWLCCACVLFANRLLPLLNRLGLILVLGGVFVTILVCAIMPSTKGPGHATNQSVWKDWNNQTGWTSNGLVFLAGMLNGAYAVGTPDCVAHLAEEIPKPRVNIPKAIAAQMVIGFGTSLCFLIAIFYSINSFEDVLNADTTFPLAEIYFQATSSRGGALGLLLIIFGATFITLVGTYIASGRMLWTLARDDATPFSNRLGRVSKTWKNPFAATFACGVVCTVMGCIYVGSTTAFNAFVGSFVVLSTLSYLAALLPHLLTRRINVTPGPFWMPGLTGMTILSISCAYIIIWDVIYFFPFSLPVTAQNMNYAVVITGGLTVFMACWWLWKSSRGYQGPVVGHTDAAIEVEDGVHPDEI